MSIVLFAGGRLDSVSVVSGSPVEVTTAGRFNATYCDAAIDCAVSGIIQATFVDASNAPVDVVTGQTVYLHWAESQTGTTVTAGTLEKWLVDSSGQPWLAIRSVSNGTLGLYYNSGTGGSPAWTLVGSTFAFGVASYLMDLKLTLGSPHTVELFRDNSSIVSGSFTQASLTALRGARFCGHTATVRTYYSQILAAEGRSTVNAKVDYNRGTGAGANTGWTGAVTNVNEAINSDATVDTAASAGLRQTYAMGNVTVPSGFSIVSVFHYLRAKNDGISPLNIKSVVRQSSTDYDYAVDMPGIGVGFAPLVARYDADPSTSVAWTESGFNSAEFGYLSAA